MTDHNAPTSVVVIGGGYAGALAANDLRLRADVDITLVNPRPEFVERIRLHQFVAGTGDATVDYGTLLGEGVQLVVDTATRIDGADRKVLLASGAGAGLRLRHLRGRQHWGAVGRARRSRIRLSHRRTRARAAAARRDRRAAPGRPDLTVVGAGLTGIEAAAELAEQGRVVTLVCGGQLAPSLSEPGRRSIAKWLARHRVDVLETAVVAEVRPDAVVLADGAVLPSAVTIWTAGFGVPDLAARSGLHTDALGRLLTDETLTSVDDDRIVAAGDAAAPSGQPLRMSCQAAQPLGAQAANTVLSRIAGTQPAVLNQAFAGSCVSLGRRAATIQFARPDDTAVNFFVGGRLGASLKEAICKGTLWSIRREARKPGSLFWFKGGRRPEQPVLEPEVVTKP